MPIESAGSLQWVVQELDKSNGILDLATVRRVLNRANPSAEELNPYVEARTDGYARRSVIRRENYELLVLTWTASQGSVVHDHSGSTSGMKVLRGRLIEEFFQRKEDGRVGLAATRQMSTGDVAADSGGVTHAIGNESESGETLVTLHIYSPPLAEIRRYIASADLPAPVFLRRRPPGAASIVIVGGGFTGSMVLANLLRLGGQLKAPLHITFIDRHSSPGEGVAYRTGDPRHLLNVPAGRMSAWTDRADDFLQYARTTNPEIQSTDFLPRKLYGQYVRHTLRRVAEEADDQLSVELLQDEATSLTPNGSSRWTVRTASGREISANAALLAVGHRPPNEPFGSRWSGPRHRFISDPWPALTLGHIRTDESVLLLGTGLTAVDAILTIDSPDRTAPVIAVSRRGLFPRAHLVEARPAADVTKLIDGWLDSASTVTIRELMSQLRDRISAASETATDWRQVIDGLRPVISRLWGRMSPFERKRFVRHVRPFWEVHRHRMAPDVGRKVEDLRKQGSLEVVGGTLISATADADGVDVVIARRGNPVRRSVRVSWVVNCTGPGAHNRHSTHPILRPLLEAGILANDELDLGLQTDPTGRALDMQNRILPGLLVAGTLRKSTLWESTAVPELREQAAMIARAAFDEVSDEHQRVR